MSNAPSTPSWFPYAQTGGAAVIAGALLLAPGVSQTRLIVPLSRFSDPVQVAMTAGGKVVARGPGGAIVVRGGAIGTVAMLRQGLVVIAAPDGACGGGTSA